MARIELRQVRKELDGDRGSRGFILGELDLELPDGQVTAILGPSGCGKSTLLRLVAGLIRPDSGLVLYDGVDVDEAPPGERKIGMVFQNYALYPNFDNKENVLSYFLFRKKTPELEREKEELYRRTAELLGVEIEQLMGRMPKGLSGGEQQRVAIARCITRDPRLFLLDEPFSNLDQKLREKYRVQLRVLLKQFDVTTVYVTHDQVEALILADRIALMNGGRIVQVGSPEEIHGAPRDVFAADFLNFEPEMPAINFLDGSSVSAELAGLTVGARPSDIAAVPAGSDGPEAAAPGAPGPAALRLRGELVDARSLPLRNETILCVRAAGAELYVRAGAAAGVDVGSKVDLTMGRYHLFDALSGERVRTVG
jgi:multiple sugar transport system ATP-binding protein